MSFTVDDFSDLLKIIEARPEWRRQLRRALFPEIDVPKALQDLAEAQRQTEESLKRLEESLGIFSDRTEASLKEAKTERDKGFAEAKAERDKGFAQAKAERDRLSERVETGFTEAKAERDTGFAEAKAERDTGFAEAKAERDRLSERMETGFAEAKAERDTGFAEAKAERDRLSERMETGFAEAKTERDRLSERMETGFAEAKSDRQSIKHDVSRLKGLVHEQFYQNRAISIFGYYLKRGQEATEWIADQLQAAQEAGQISSEEYLNVMAADLLWRGQLRQAAEQEIVLVIEASWLIEAHDVERAADRAAILRRLGLKALPVVAGREWTDDILEMARKEGIVLTNNGRVDGDSWQAALAKSDAG